MQAIEPMAGSPALVTQLQNVTAGVPAVMTQRVKITVAANLYFGNCKILFADGVQRIETHQHAIIH